MKRLRVYTKATGFVEIELLYDRNPKTVNAVLRVLPIESMALRWGDEVYFEVPVYIEKENAQEIVEKGDVAYWDTGHCICIFFGPTPATMRDEIRAAEPVNVFGRVIGDPEVFRRVRSGDKIRLELVRS
ncbi:MAG: hypothetical protein DRJ51_06150 [Thermoprotei archaeon]|nr:MAG: hypothetical protein DRJ51_06150 [Thermoprotei archaeon]